MRSTSIHCKLDALKFKSSYWNGGYKSIFKKALSSLRTVHNTTDLKYIFSIKIRSAKKHSRRTRRLLKRGTFCISFVCLNNCKVYFSIKSELGETKPYTMYKIDLFLCKCKLTLSSNVSSIFDLSVEVVYCGGRQML